MEAVKNKKIKDLVLFAEAWFLLLIWKLTCRLLPLRWYASCLGKQQASTAEVPIEDPRIRAVIRAIARGKKYSPWKIKCLAEAIAAQQMLNRRKIPSTLYLGIARKGEQKIIAHAWLRCGVSILTGKRGMKRFTVVSSFAHSPGSAQTA
jgi:hypothetical protein